MKSDPVLLERYMKDPLSRRLGNLGSELLRLSKAVASGEAEKVEKLLRLCLDYVELAGRDFPVDIAEVLADIQRVLTRYLHSVPNVLSDTSIRFRHQKELELYAQLIVRLVPELEINI